MRCTSPRTVGFGADGKTIVWSAKQFVKLNGVSFQLPCGKCIECRLEYAREWAVRCVHESKMHENNAFITLTYDDEHLESPKLIYSDFQKWMKKIRKGPYIDPRGRLRYAYPDGKNAPAIGVMVVGEYGEKTKRPHWHAIVFNWAPPDGVYLYSNERGDKSYTSEILSKTWGKGRAEFGEVTFQSAGYCARYSAKKLVHGRDESHEFHPISKKSSKHAIGKKYLEKFWPDIFNSGEIRLSDGSSCSIPRYYERWFKENHPEEWLRYVTGKKQTKMDLATAQDQKQKMEYAEQVAARAVLTSQDGIFRGHPRSFREAKKINADAKFKMLQAYLKL